MSGFRIEGNTSGNVVEVDNNNNLKTNLPTLVSEAGMAIIAGQNDPGTYTVGNLPYNINPAVSASNRLRVGEDTPEFDYNFTWTSQDTGVWKYAFTTMTASQSGGFVTFNVASTNTTTTGVYLQTWRTFNPICGSLAVSFNGLLSNPIPANEVHELGLYYGTITTAPADGVYFRLTSAGIMGVLNFNGVETTQLFSAAAASAILIANNSFSLNFTIYSGQVDFYIDGNFLGTISMAAGNSYPFLTAALPVCVTQRNTGTVSGPQQYKLGHVKVLQVDTNINMPMAHQLVAQGGAGSQAPQGNVQGSTALFTNSLAASAGAVMTNTTAALGVGLGGQFTTTPTLAANTDGIVCSFQNLLGTTAIQPRILMITGVKIMSVVSAALTGGPCIWAYSLAYGHTALSMATAEGTSYTTNPTTKAPRRVALGVETMAATAAIGVVGSAEGIYTAFNSPIPVNPGEFVAICAKNMGTVTSVGTVTFFITFDSYWL